MQVKQMRLETVGTYNHVTFHVEVKIVVAMLTFI